MGLIDKSVPVVQPEVLPEGAESSEGVAVLSPRNIHEEASPRESAAGQARAARGQRPDSEALRERKPTRKCAECGSLMYESEYVSPRNSILGLGDVTEWQCQKCGQEIKVAGARRLLLALLGCPMIVLWWVLFSRTSPFADPQPSWWLDLIDQVSPKTSTGAFWYIAFLLLFALAPLELLRQIVTRFRNPRVKRA